MAAAMEKAQVFSLGDLTAVAREAAAMNADEARSVIASLRSLYLFKASADAAVPDLVTDLINALHVPDEQKEELTLKLTQLLSVSALDRAYKIEQLKSDYHNVFYDAKILTDLRPVFDKPDAPPIGATITNTLKIICHEYEDHKELYFSMEPENLAQLKRIVERAELKMSSLRTFLKSSNLPELS
jgi:hypothetical protein